jgi:hypothetical protein
MEHHGCVFVKRTDCSAGILARIHPGTIAEFGFTVVAPLSRPTDIASGGWEAASTAGLEAGATIRTAAPSFVGFQGRSPWLELLLFLITGLFFRRAIPYTSFFRSWSAGAGPVMLKSA